MSEVSDTIIKATQGSLGKIIKRPVLTDKLLRKPPFKFLHDIITGVIRLSGYLNGLYSEEELQSENIKDREAKIAFLQKTIDVVKITTQLDLKARPSKIVAGLEADKTNELLQAIAKAVDRKIDSTEAVEAVKSGNVPGKAPKDSKQTKTQTKTGKSSKDVAGAKRPKNDTNQIKQKSEKKKPTANTTKLTKKSSKDSKDNKDEKETKKNLSVPNKESEHTNETAPKNTIKKESLKKKDESAEKAMPESPPKIENVLQNDSDLKLEKAIKATIRQPSLEKEQNIMTEKTPEVEIVGQPPSEEEPIQMPIEETVRNLSGEKPSEKSFGEMSKSSKPKTINDSPIENDIHIESKNKVKSAKSIERVTESKSLEKENKQPTEDNVSNMTNGTANTQRPGTTLRSAALRPVSARPSAPRRRDRNVKQILHTENFIQDPNSQNGSEKKSDFSTEFDDADNIVITNVIQDNVSSLDIASDKIEDELDGKQGHLVQQILETRTTILRADPKDDGQLIPDENVINERKSIARNMTELRKSIQKLSLYINPLGKMMEYFQEDVDAMQIELMMWQKAYTTAETDIKEEKRKTEELLEQFKYHLAEVNNSIKEHTEQINNATINIIQNEEKISKLIATL